MLPANLLTNSRAKMFRDCQRRHHFAYVLGFKPVEVPHALWFGDACIHVPLQGYWCARRDGLEGPLGAALDALPKDADPFDLARARVMLCAYATIWDAVECEVLDVEIEFTLPLIHPLTGEQSRTWTLAGKLDLVIRLANGKTAIVEHKSTSADPSAGSDYRRRLTLDTQISQYVAGAEALGHPADLVIYDILRKPDQRPLKATPEESRKYTEPRSKACPECKKKKAAPGPHRDPETGGECVDGRIVTDPGGKLYANQREADETPEEYEDRLAAVIAENVHAYIERIDIHRFENERAAFGVDVWKLGQSMALVEQLGLEVPNPDACFRQHGATCPYLPVCEGTADLYDATRYRLADNPHEELNHVTQPAAESTAA